MTDTATAVRRSFSPIVAAVELLVHSNVFISLSATSVAVTTVLLADLRPDPVPLFIVFAATLFVYSFNRITDISEDEENVPRRANFTRRYGRALFAVGVVLYLTALVLAFVFDLPGATFVALPVVVGIVYSVGRAKRVLLVKNLIVGFAWGAIPLGVGVYYGVLFDAEVLFLSVFFGVTLTVAAALFDIKDIEGDRQEGIRTVPNVYGSHATRIGSAIVYIALVPVVLASASVVSRDLLVLLVYLCYTVAYTPFATRDRGTLFYGLVIDGEHVFLAGTVVLAELAGYV
ncbi:UbiA family prenyltransferase [Haladaptatus sp. F3-133]|uniref:UbiA family prenyltransferase n=1 Tax=Halorutilus salinus TaxID=2487751 RepID=A0A9Q4C5L7_9EURY|nr:UbiA family prenyltransferase [Halorutilus salinus]MCX2819550.1 UbiA family prenyltransferase [Halorutilus salinus]